MCLDVKTEGAMLFVIEIYNSHLSSVGLRVFFPATLCKLILLADHT